MFSVLTSKLYSMESMNVKSRILMEMDKLIVQSSGATERVTKKMRSFHEAIIKKHYNASDVNIDYHRHRIKMNVIMDEGAYDPKTVNIGLPILPMNLFFKNFNEFLNSCVENDAKSIGFYAKLIKDLSTKEKMQIVA